MNRVKKYIHSKGIKLECDYPTLPFFVKGKSIFEPGYIFIDGILVDSEKVTVTTYYNVIKETIRFERDGSITESFE